jgi:hypothetical protein
MSRKTLILRAGLLPVVVFFIGSETGDEDNLFAVMNLDVTGEEKALYPVARWLVVKGFQVSRDRHL